MDAEEFIAKGGADPRGGAIAPPRGGVSLAHCMAMRCRQAIASNRREPALPGVPPGGASDRTRNINHRS